MKVFKDVLGPKGTPQDLRKSQRPKQHYAVAPGHWERFIKALGPLAEFLAENTEAGHKARYSVHCQCIANPL